MTDRERILTALPGTAVEVAEKVGLPTRSVSTHLMWMRGAGLVREDRSRRPFRWEKR